MPKLSQQDAVLFELWQNALFNDQAFLLIKEFSQSMKLDKHFMKKARQTLATIRNRNLISAAQQTHLEKQVVGIFGLSVGSHVAATWIMESRATVIKIADPDSISPSNLNRLRTGWKNVGHQKTRVMADELQTLHPDILVIKDDKPTKQSMEGFFTTSPTLTAVVDAIDDFQGKIWLRQLCRQHHLPLISAADVGDNVILDIERYDLDPQPELFLGRLGDIEQINFNALSLQEKRKLIIKLVGFEANSHSLLDSLLAIGQSLATWPQLGATATIAGGVVTTTLKKIFSGEKVMSGRFILSLDALLISDYDSQENKEITHKKVLAIKSKFNL